MEKDIYKTSRFLYILEAAFEYFISLLMVGAYLAKVTTAIGISDSLTGILTSFVSLGCTFQLFAIFLANKGAVKRKVTILHSINQLFFACIYLVPFFNISKQFKIVLFIIFLLCGHVINNIVNAPKINWFMSLVDDDKRGSFTAGKEIVSLIGGMIFTFIVGMVIDYYESINNQNGIFIFCAIGVLGLMLLHTATLIFSKEKVSENSKRQGSSFSNLISLLKDKKLVKIIILSCLWNVANYATTPFYGTYQIKELGFSMLFVSILSAMYAIIRAIASKPLGKYGDRFSFRKMLMICFSFAFCSFLINTFTAPENGKWLYTIYYVLYAISMAGINSGEMNIIFDNVEKSKRMGALALKSTFAGLAGFLTTLAVSPLVSYIQNNGNVIFGIPVYAQQLLSAIGAVVVLIIMVYLVLNKDLKKQEK